MKFYSTSGDFKFITNADDPIEACYKALQKARREGARLEKYFYVDERGFRGQSEDNIIDTEGVPSEQIKIDGLDDQYDN